MNGIYLTHKIKKLKHKKLLCMIIYNIKKKKEK